LNRDVRLPRCRLGPAGPGGTALLLLGLAAVCEAADFSADIVSLNDRAARIFAADGKVRIETPEAASGFFLIDERAGTIVFVRPEQRIFSDARQSSRLTQLFVPVDPNNPCAQWQASAGRGTINSGAAEEWHCEKIGAELLEGRATIQWRVTAPDRSSGRYWIDSSLGFPVRVQMTDGATFHLEHVRVAPQSPALFAIPPTYHRLDPRTLIERIKHSDVWVEAPH
jgi:hypothetical protein